MASDIRAGRAFVEIFTKDNLSKTLDKISGKMKSWGASMIGMGAKISALGGALSAPFLIAAQQFASMGDELSKASDRTGASVESLSALKYAAEQSGSSLGDVESGMRKLSKVTLAAANGNKAAQATLDQLGVSLDDIKNLSPDEQFKLVAQRLSEVEDASTRAALAQKIFGGAGAALLPMVKDGAKGIDALAQRAKDLGLIFEQGDTDAATKFGDTLDDLLKQFRAIIFYVGAAIAKALQPFADWLTEILPPIIAWVKSNQQLVVTIAAVAGGIVAAGAVITALGAALAGLGLVLSGLVAGVGAVAAVIGAIVSPIGLVIAALVAGAGYFLFYTETGQKAVAGVKSAFTNLLAQAKETFGGIADALSAGDITLAGQILWASLKLVWQKGVAYLLGEGDKFGIDFVSTFYKIGGKVGEFLVKLISSFKSAFTIIGRMWDAITDTIGQKMGKSMAKSEAMADIKKRFGGQTITKENVAEISRMQLTPAVEAQLRQQSGGDQAKFEQLLSQKWNDFKQQNQGMIGRTLDNSEIEKLGQASSDAIDAMAQAQSDAIKKQRDAETNARLDAIATEEQSRLDAVKQWAQGGQDAAAEAAKNRNAGVDAAQAELDDLLKKAAKEKADKEAKAAESWIMDWFNEGKGKSDSGKNRKVENLQQAISETTFKALGQFGAGNLQQFAGGVGSYRDPKLEEAKKQTTLLKKIADNTEDDPEATFTD